MYMKKKKTMEPFQYMTATTLDTEIAVNSKKKKGRGEGVKMHSCYRVCVCMCGDVAVVLVLPC